MGPPIQTDEARVSDIAARISEVDPITVPCWECGRLKSLACSDNKDFPFCGSRRTLALWIRNLEMEVVQHEEASKRAVSAAERAYKKGLADAKRLLARQFRGEPMHISELP